MKNMKEKKSMWGKEEKQVNPFNQRTGQKFRSPPDLLTLMMHSVELNPSSPKKAAVKTACAYSLISDSTTNLLICTGLESRKRRWECWVKWTQAKYSQTLQQEASSSWQPKEKRKRRGWTYLDMAMRGKQRNSFSNTFSSCVVANMDSKGWLTWQSIVIVRLHPMTIIKGFYVSGGREEKERCGGVNICSA